MGSERQFYMSKIAPQDMRQHFMLNLSRLSTVEELPRKLKITRMQTRNFRVMARTKLQLVKAMRKVENLVECHATLERVVEQRAKDQCTKDSDFNPSAVGQRKFGGYCNWCCPIGHKEAQ